MIEDPMAIGRWHENPRGHRIRSFPAGAFPPYPWVQVLDFAFRNRKLHVSGHLGALRSVRISFYVLAYVLLFSADLDDLGS